MCWERPPKHFPEYSVVGPNIRDSLQPLWGRSYRTNLKKSQGSNTFMFHLFSFSIMLESDASGEILAENIIKRDTSIDPTYDPNRIMTEGVGLLVSVCIENHSKSWKWSPFELNQFMLITIGQCNFPHDLFDSSAREEIVTLNLQADIMPESLVFFHFNIFFSLLPLALVTCHGD